MTRYENSHYSPQMADKKRVMTEKFNAQFPKRDSFRIAGYDLASRFSFALKSERCSRKKLRHNDEGSMLVEVLVALLILVIVFTSAVLALSDMASKRVAIEQRDRAVRLLTEYEELTRIERCGLIVDVLNSSPASLADFNDSVQRCDFISSTVNAGDVEDFEVDDNAGRLIYTLNIRYWWEVPGTDIHTQSCGTINTSFVDGVLPSIFVRAFEIRWREKGSWVTETLVKKDPVPVDNVIFAVGNRASLLVNATNAKLTLQPSVSSPGVNRINDNLFPGQPQNCIWFPYISQDSTPFVNGVNFESDIESTDPLDLEVVTP